MAKSIYDVAQETGLSVSTVSRALNGYNDVSAKTRARVVEAAKRLGYVPNTSAKNLSSKNKKNVALLICGLLEEAQSNEFMMNVIQGAYTYMMKHEINLAMYSIGKEEQEKRILTHFAENIHYQEP
jgi:LacI family transcriptional regulator